MTKNEALKLALKFVEDSECGTADLEAHIKEALAQEQEPAATIAVREHAPVGKVAYVLEVDLPVGIHKLYTTPPERTWVGLTNDEIALINADYPYAQGFARAIEAKLKQKNG